MTPGTIPQHKKAPQGAFSFLRDEVSWPGVAGDTQEYTECAFVNEMSRNRVVCVSDHRLCSGRCLRCNHVPRARKQTAAAHQDAGRFVGSPGADC